MQSGTQLDRSELLQVYGHVRSGNNVLAASLQRRFYPSLDLKGEDGQYGHWSDRQFTEGSPYGKLIGSHEHFPQASLPGRTVYIHRDARAVAYSLWRSSHFMNVAWRGISFSEFLRRPLDWDATPGRRRNYRWYQRSRENVLQHWRRHVEGWLGSGDRSICCVGFEELILDPGRTIAAIGEVFSIEVPVRPRVDNTPLALVGYSPNEGSIAAWKSAFSDQDRKYYSSIIGKDFEEWRLAHGVGPP